MATIENVYQLIGLNPVDTAKLLSMLDLQEDDFAFANRLEMFKDVVNTLKRLNGEDVALYIRRVTLSERDDKLKKMWEYVKIVNERREKIGELVKHSHQREFLEEKGENDEEYKQTVQKIDSTMKNISNLDRELELYER